MLQINFLFFAFFNGLLESLIKYWLYNWLYIFDFYFMFQCGALIKLGGSPMVESCFFFCAFHRQVINNKRRLAAVAESNTPTGTIQIPQFTSLLASSSAVTNTIKLCFYFCLFVSFLRTLIIGLNMKFSNWPFGRTIWIEIGRWSNWTSLLVLLTSADLLRLPYPVGLFGSSQASYVRMRQVKIIRLGKIYRTIFPIFTGLQSSSFKQARTVVWIHCWPSRLGFFDWVV